MDRKEGVAQLVCKVCDQRFQSKVNRESLYWYAIAFRLSQSPQTLPKLSTFILNGSMRLTQLRRKTMFLVGLLHHRPAPLELPRRAMRTESDLWSIYHWLRI